MRKKAEKMVKLHRELNCAPRQLHKLNVDRRGKPLHWWPIVEEWKQVLLEAQIKKEEQSIPLKVKKEEPSSPKIPIKVE